MEFLSQYDDISDGEEEAELQRQQLAARSHQPHAYFAGAFMAPPMEHAMQPTATAAESEASGTEDSSSYEDEEQEEYEEAHEPQDVVAPVGMPAGMSDIHYAALVAGLLDQPEATHPSPDPQEIPIDSFEFPIGSLQFPSESIAPASESHMALQEDAESSDTSDDDEPEEREPHSRSYWLTEEEMQNGVAEDEVPRTKHELDPELTPLGEILLEPQAPVNIVGTVLYRMDHECTLVVQAEATNTPLGEGSIVCLQDRSVIGKVYETFGPVTTPFYVVRWHPTQLPPDGAGAGSTAYSPRAHAVLVTPQSLVSKGCDASNIYDEELPENEQEFSDDEQEALIKSAKKKRSRGQGKTKHPQMSADTAAAAAAAAAAQPMQFQQQPPVQYQQFYPAPSYPYPAQPIQQQQQQQQQQMFQQFTPSPMYMSQQVPMPYAAPYYPYPAHVAQAPMYPPQHQQQQYMQQQQPAPPQPPYPFRPT